MYPYRPLGLNLLGIVLFSVFLLLPTICNSQICGAGYGTSIIHTSDFSSKVTMVADGWTVNCAQDASSYDTYAVQCQTDVS